MATLIMETCRFLHLPKCAGSWITSAIANAGIKHQVVSTELQKGHLDYQTCPRPDLPSIICVREPLSWYKSYWAFKMGRGWDQDNQFDHEFQSDSFRKFINKIIARQRARYTECLEVFTGPNTHAFAYDRLKHGLVESLRKFDIDFKQSAILHHPAVNRSAQNYKAGAIYTQEQIEALSELEESSIRYYLDIYNQTDFSQDIQKCASNECPTKIGLIITTRDRPHLLPMAIESALAQTFQPEMVLIVDNGTDHQTRDLIQSQYPHLVEYIQTGEINENYLPIAQVRNQGIRYLLQKSEQRRSSLTHLCFIDDDDYVPPHYLERLVETFRNQSGIGVAYPRMIDFGENAKKSTGVSYDPVRLGKSNYICSGALIRLDCLKQVGLFPQLPRGVYEDWALFRRIRSLGWPMALSQAEYYHRKSADSIQGREKHPTSIRNMDQSHDFLTIAIPFSGKLETLDYLLDALDNQEVDLSQISLLFLDNSNSEEFSSKLRDWLRRCDSHDARYVKYPNQSIEYETHDERRIQTTAVNHRVAGIWRRIGQLLSTDFVWCLEDDTIPPPGCLKKLLNQMTYHMDAICVPYPGRYGNWNVWNYIGHRTMRFSEFTTRKTNGLERVGGCSFGCVLMRSHLLRNTPIYSMSAQTNWYDPIFWSHADARLYCDWNQVCRHIIYQEGDERNPSPYLHINPREERIHISQSS